MKHWQLSTYGLKKITNSERGDTLRSRAVFIDSKRPHLCIFLGSNITHQLLSVAKVLEKPERAMLRSL